MAGCFNVRIDYVRTLDQSLLEIFSNLYAVKEDGVRIKSYVTYTCWIIGKTQYDVLAEWKELNIQYAMYKLRVAGQEYDDITSNMQVGRGSGITQEIRRSGFAVVLKGSWGR
ncbi:hypothetical protein PTKIN_Ptkin18bG0059400 [Pterospermum kingtungense]